MAKTMSPDAEGGSERPLTHEEVAALRGEILGAGVVIEVAPGVVGLPLRGELVDETLHTLVLRIAGHERLRRIPKHGLRGTILLGGRQLPLRGDTLRVRPEDRTKRLTFAGPRRSP
ncbi:MAG: ribonuclease P protein subunit [Thermoplasmata archaeon]|nr:ribonuclease P protein subunit [Thermoplasmata archaeon]